jgi:hypothetical protein
VKKYKIAEETEPTKVYKNSECFGCFLSFHGELKIKEHPKTKKRVILCETCYKKLQRENR